MKNKILAAFTACAVIMSFSGCGEDTENMSGMSSMTQSTNSGTESSAFESSTSDLMGSDSETSDTDEQEQLEKIPMTEDECWRLMSSDQFYYATTTLKNGFDLTKSINDVDALKYALRILPELGGKADDSKNNMPEDFVGGALSYTCMYKPETAERQIREYLLPSFKIDSVDYKNSDLWDPETGYIKAVCTSSDDECQGLVESAYRSGDYYYANMLLTAYSDTRTFSGYLATQTLNEENLNMPLVQVKFKKVTVKNEYGEFERFIPIGFDPANQRPEWVETAAKLLAALNCEDVKRYNDSSDIFLHEVGVMDGNLGKRMYIKYFSEMGLRHYSRCDGFMTFGLRGENDIISFASTLDSNTITYPGTDTEDMRMREIVSNETTIHDNFNGETYSHCSIHDSDEGDTVTYTLNGNEITKDEFDSAQTVVYFKDVGSPGDISTEDKSHFIYKCKNNFGKLTLADLYDLARVMTD